MLPVDDRIADALFRREGEVEGIVCLAAEGYQRKQFLFRPSGLGFAAQLVESKYGKYGLFVLAALRTISLEDIADEQVQPLVVQSQ